ncbi:hypothetical protein EVJ29_13930 [Exiguobacterium sp. SH4S7]|uniref:HAAS signaling domain-containing protein n=1 Tax=Exiguobacterium sp. SH4S7 TaxID=2510958 RepID=UPI001039CE60|nr:hypothetical protein [Exiguobacterium sp. SH4S7]TCI33495.1 hypothetical protein EVJ29_13930 [Exiguobacterium sp. SH4S7]
MNLRDVYIAEVTSRIPESMREDVALELESTIDDMTGDDPSEKALLEALRQLGDPNILAARYANRPLHLIGPALFPGYVSILKTVLPIAITLSIILATIAYLADANVESSWVQFIVQGLVQISSAIFEVVIQTFFWITLVFFIIERASPEGDVPLSKWSPEKLKNVKPRTKFIPLSSIVFDFVMVVVLMMLYVNTDQWIRLSIDGETFPLINPEILDRFFPFVIALAVFDIGIGVYKWVARYWTKPLALWNVALNVLWIGVTALILLQPELISSEALALLAERTSVALTTLTQWGVWSIVLTVVVVCLIDLIEGCYKAFRP